jgi:hypothetical protein
MWKENNKFFDISFWNSNDDRIDSLSAEIDFDVYNLIKKMYTSSETKTNKELGGEYWTKSHDLHMKDNEIESPMPTMENATLTRLVERDVNVEEEPNTDGGPTSTVNGRVINQGLITFEGHNEQQIIEYDGG